MTSNKPVVIKDSELETEKAGKLAHKYHSHLVQLKKNACKTFLEIGQMLSEISEKKLYVTLGHQTMTEYLGDPEVSMSDSVASRLIHVYRKFVRDLKVPAKEIEDIDYNKLFTIKGVVEQDTADEWIEKARTLSRSSLNDEVLVFKGKAPKEHTPATTHDLICPRCGYGGKSDEFKL